MKQLVIMGILLWVSGFNYAQTIVDKIVATVSDEPILYSDVESSYWQLVSTMDSVPTDPQVQYELRCMVLYQLIQQQMLVRAAEEDSIEISPQELEAELNRRMEYFIQMLGSREKLEEFYGKSIEQIKDELRDDLRKQMLAQRKQQTLIGEVTISPAEVEAFYHQLSKDTLPLIEAQYSIGIIVKKVKPLPWQWDLARQKAEELMDKIKSGQSFESLAMIYSDDKESAFNGGDLGTFTWESLPEWLKTAVVDVDSGSLLGPIQSEQGWHIILIADKTDYSFRIKHILIKPPLTSENSLQAQRLLDSIRTEIMKGSLTFQEAARLFSDDEETKHTGGMLLNPTNARPYVPASLLPAYISAILSTLEQGEISKPQPVKLDDGSQAYIIVWFRDEIPPHRLSLQYDYEQIQQMALAARKQEIIEQWTRRRARKTYINVDDYFRSCEFWLEWFADEKAK